MKTSELIKEIKELGLLFKETEGFITVDGFITISKKHSCFTTVHTIYNIPILYDLIKLAVEYSETPIEERGEEKHYYICLPKCFDQNDVVLNLDLKNNNYFFADTDESEKFKSKFTNKQISEMPIEIQKAIECGFLKKVEVEEKTK